MSRITLTAAAVLVAVLALASTASAGTPFRFQNRTAFEASAAKVVRATFPLRLRRTVTRSMGCAKYGVGHSYCVLVVQSTTRTHAVRVFAVRISCPSDSGAGCRVTMTELDQ